MTEIDIAENLHNYLDIDEITFDDNSEDGQSFIVENPPYNDFDEHYIDSPMIDEEFWEELNNRRMDELLDKENLDEKDNYILDWERDDDKHHEKK